MRSRVFVLEPTNLDLSSAEPFGDIIFVFDEHETRPSIWETGEFLEAVQRKLEQLNFNPDVDYFCCAGSMVPLISMINYLSNVYPQFRLLLWNSTIREYVVRSFSHDDYHDTTIRTG